MRNSLKSKDYCESFLFICLTILVVCILGFNLYMVNNIHEIRKYFATLA